MMDNPLSVLFVKTVDPDYRMLADTLKPHVRLTHAADGFLLVGRRDDLKVTVLAVLLAAYVLSLRGVRASHMRLDEIESICGRQVQKGAMPYQALLAALQMQGFIEKTRGRRPGYRVPEGKIDIVCKWIQEVRG
jgi:hypothetical protein